MPWTIAALAAAVALLFFSDALAFHDLFEPHTVRDWLVLFATGLAVVALAGRWLARSGVTSRHH